MEICLHLGAHRTATTLLQNYLDDNRHRLTQAHTGYWGPKRLRQGGLFSDLLRQRGLDLFKKEAGHKRAIGRLKMEIDRARQNGVTCLIASDENLLGKLSHNLDQETLYPQAYSRLAKIAPAIGGNTIRIGLSIRSYDTYWSSVIAKRLMKGGAEPSTAKLERLANQQRRWRDVIEDIAKVLPEAELFVWPYETWGGQPSIPLAPFLGLSTQDFRPFGRTRVNTSRDGFLLNRERAKFDIEASLPNGQYMPFSQRQRRILQQAYQADIAWLSEGAADTAMYLGTPHQEFNADGWVTSAPRHKKRVFRSDDIGRSNDRQEARMG